MLDRKEIYLDNSATTRIREEALAVYNEVSREEYGNPSSLHELGFRAEKRLNEAKKTILGTLGAKDAAVVFTASGSEANNLAILGRAYAKERYKRGAKILTTEGEHASVSSPIARLQAEGYRVARIPTKGGLLDMEALERELTADVILVSMMMVNNETGALYDLRAVADRMKKRCPEAILHADATQSYLKVPFTKASVGADLITISSHKIEGPKGVGALIVSEAVLREKGLSALILGGGQEGGLRSGTENLPGACAFAEAARLARQEMDGNIEIMSSLRKLLLANLHNDPDLAAISPTEPPLCAPHILNITLPGIKSETMLHFLSSKGIYVSSGSACSSHSSHASSALIAFGRSEKEADCSIRISFSPRNEPSDVEALCEALKEGLGKLARTEKKR